jgi:hypothetical protein
MHPLVLGEKQECNMTELRTWYRRTVKSIGVLFHNIVMRVVVKEQQRQRLKTRFGQIA